MPILVPGVATRSRQPTLLVENKLEVGAWRFRLTVVDNAGLESSPAELVVRVIPPPRQSRPIIRPVDPRIRDPQLAPVPARPTKPVRPARRPRRPRRPAP